MFFQGEANEANEANEAENVASSIKKHLIREMRYMMCTSIYCMCIRTYLLVVCPKILLTRFKIVYVYVLRGRQYFQRGL